jgi:hypothetical protein
VEAFWLGRAKAAHVEKSGSCALVAVVTEGEAWIVNLGDSRALAIHGDGRV